MAGRTRLAGLFVSIVVVTGFSGPASNATQLPLTPEPKSESRENAVDEREPDAPSEADLDSLTLPIISEEMSNLASELMKNFAGDPQFASAEIPDDRSRVIVHWHGTRSPELSDMLDHNPSVAVEVRQTKFKPGVLRQRAEQLKNGNKEIKAHSIKHDGSGIGVSVGKESQNRSSKQELARKYEYAVKVPVEVAYGEPKPAEYERQYDMYWHLGGARIHAWAENGDHTQCTSGFTVRNPNTGQYGSMFAAHCVVPDWTTGWGVWREGDPTYDLFGLGNVVETVYSRDGAIIAGESVGHPFIWTSTWDSDSYEQIQGDRYPYIGMEICYSGSYSGLKCGNIVRASESYTFNGWPGDITGFRTEQSNGEPAAGNGDSGGPGYQFVSNTTTGPKRLAVGIISAIPTDSGTTCQGVPGEFGVYGRKCSSTVWATSVSDIEIATGWHIPEVP